KYLHARPQRTSRASQITSCGVRDGDRRPAHHRPSAARNDRDPLLARHPLEPSLISKFDRPEPPLVVVLGPTASGKTALSIALGERFHGEIVNCDSVAMYREFEIGTAKPSAAERALVPHHLFDCVEPAAYMTAGEYSRQARRVLAEISARGHLPI